MSSEAVCYPRLELQFFRSRDGFRRVLHPEAPERYRPRRYSFRSSAWPPISKGEDLADGQSTVINARCHFGIWGSSDTEGSSSTGQNKEDSYKILLYRFHR